MLSLAVHEFRTPLTVVSGYLRMLLKDSAGALTEPQRRLVTETQKSVARLSTLTEQLADLSLLEGGGAPFNCGSVELGSLVAGEIAAIPPVDDRAIGVSFEDHSSGARVHADPVRLRTAVAALLVIVRRELITSSEMYVRLRRIAGSGQPALRLTIAGSDRIEEVDRAEPDSLLPFDEFRGGVGFTLPVARHILQAHRGQVWSAPLPAGTEHTDPTRLERAGAVVLLPEA